MPTANPFDSTSNPMPYDEYQTVEELSKMFPAISKLSDAFLVDAIYNSLIRYAPKLMLDPVILGSHLASAGQMGFMDAQTAGEIIYAELRFCELIAQ